MKTIKCLFTAFILLIAFGCRNNISQSQSVTIKDTNFTYYFEAKYPKGNTEKLQIYLDSILNTNLPLADGLDVQVPFNTNGGFNLKAKEGYLEIDFDKEKNSYADYMEVKKIVKGIRNKLNEK